MAQVVRVRVAERATAVWLATHMGVQQGDESCWDLCCDPPDNASRTPPKKVEVIETADIKEQQRKDKLQKELLDVEHTQEALDIRFARNTEELLNTLEEEKKDAQKELDDIQKQKKELEQQVSVWKKHRDETEDILVKEVHVAQKRFCSVNCATQ